MNQLPVSPDDILAFKASVGEAQPITGVYFLIDGNEVVYVGRAANVLLRIYQHVQDAKKVFDHYFYIKCSPREAEQIEPEYIVHFGPKYNTVLPSTSKWRRPEKLHLELGGTLGQVLNYIVENQIKDTNGFFNINDFEGYKRAIS